MEDSPTQSTPPVDRLERRALPIWALLALTVASTEVFYLALSNNWWCSSIAAAILASLAALLLHAVLLHRLARAESVLAVIFIALGAALLFRTTKEEAFKLAFGVEPPPGVRQLEAEGGYIGGPGEKWFCLRFVADRPTMEKLLSTRPFVRDEGDLLERYWKQERNSQEIWNRLLKVPLPLAGQFWQEAPPLSEPVIYRCEPSNPLKGWTAVLWDVRSDRVYARYCLP